MDIAEIRKKARSAGSGKSQTAAVALEEKPVTDADPVAVDEPDVRLPEALPPAAPAPDPPPAPQPASDPLDRLFAAHDNLGLATEEIYQQALAAGSDQGVRDVEQYLAFQLGQEEYALDIKQISEIIKARELTEIPRVPDFILGIISLRGVVVPVFDLRQRLRLGKAQVTAASRVIVCRVDEAIIGLLVDSINQVVTLAGGRLEPPPSVLSGLDREMIAGVGRFKGRMVIVLNLPSVMTIETS
ncbi:MAG: chemotaxis protein CheW [Desulfuromonadales bacterium]|nr:chemotaxis protein CheW [Desulfuromonadales bacterium]